MKLSNRKETKNREPATVAAPQTSGLTSFSIYPKLPPLSEAEVELCRSLRNAVPIVDAALDKTVRLVGNFKVVCAEKGAQGELDSFLENVRCNGGNRGIYCFVTSYLNELLTCGEAVGEIVLSASGTEVAALYNANPRDVKIVADQNPLNLLVCKNDGALTPAPNQNLILPTLLNPEPGTVKGRSVLAGLPFVSSVLLKIFESVGKNFERVGNIRFAVTCKNDSTSQAVSKKQAQQIADEWSRAMKSDRVCDFVAVGDVSVKVIGAENQMLDCDVPVRHLLEQIVAKLALPPFVLGLSWSTSERMSVQQADILTSELEHYRLLLTPIISKICSTFLRLRGYSDNVKVRWDHINLQDEVELSQARLNNARAAEIESKLGIRDEE